MAGGIAAGMFYGFGASGGQQQGPTAAQEMGPPIATIGSFKVYATSVDAAMAQQLSQFGEAAASLGPEFQARVLAQALQTQLDQGLTLALAEQKGVVLDEKTAIQAYAKEFDNQIQQQRQMLEMTGKLKAGASEQDFIAAMRESQPGFDPEKLKQEQLDKVREALADPARKALVEASIAGLALSEQAAAAIKTTDEDLKADYDTYKIKRITILGPNGKAQADKVLAEIKSGLSFEAAMDKYSKDSPEPKKKVSESVTTVVGSTVRSSTIYAPLPKLTPGQVSEVAVDGENAAIYKLVSKTSDLPKDFAAKKSDYAKRFAMAQAQKTVGDEIKAFKEKPDQVKWESEGYRVLSQYGDLANEPNSPASAYEKVEAAAKKAIESDTLGRRPAIYALFASNSARYSKASAPEKAKLADERISAITSVLELLESSDLRLELVDLLAAKKDAAAIEQLMRVAEGNLDPSTAGQATYSGVDAKLRTLEKAGLANAEQRTKIEEFQATWRKIKVEADKAEAEAKKAQAEAEKAAKDAPKPRTKGN
jgi:hypothetical protein